MKPEFVPVTTRVNNHFRWLFVLELKKLIMKYSNSGEFSIALEMHLKFMLFSFILLSNFRQLDKCSGFRNFTFHSSWLNLCYLAGNPKNCKKCEIITTTIDEINGKFIPAFHQLQNTTRVRSSCIRLYNKNKCTGVFIPQEMLSEKQ